MTSLKKVATSGSYTDLSNKPTIAGFVGSTEIGSATNPIYWDGSKFAKTTYALNKTVPANAVFTDTTYTFATGTTDGTIKVDNTEIAVKGFSDLATSINSANQTLTSLKKVATSGSYTDLSDKPAIPSETTVSDWGFTKNAGTVTSVKINGNTYNPSSGVVDLGTGYISKSDITDYDTTLKSYLSSTYLPLNGGTLTGALTTSYLRTTSTSEAALLTGGKTSYNDGKTGIGLLASGTIASTGTAPKFIFYYGNAKSGTHYIETQADRLLRITSFLEVFNSTDSENTYIQLNKNNNRIYRFENTSSGLLYKYGGSLSTLATKGTFSTSGSYSASSDITKKNVHSYEPRFFVEDIAKAPVAYFTWKDMDDNRENLGTVAQYWKEIAPQCVYGQEGVDMTLDYSTLGLISSIINARKVVDHEERIRLLEQENKELREKIEALGVS